MDHRETPFESNNVVELIVSMVRSPDGDCYGGGMEETVSTN